MIFNSAKSIVLPTFSLTELCEESDEGASKVSIPLGANKKPKNYYRRKTSNSACTFSRSKPYEYNFFPIVISSDGSPWPEANLYILRKIEGLVNPSISTLQLVASDLADFKNFIDNENIEPFVFPKRKLLRPTYRYRNAGIIRAQAGEVSLSTVKRRVSSVISFYDWIQKEKIEIFDNPPWSEKAIYLSVTSSYGSSLIKKVRSTDLSIKAVNNKNPYSEDILDGGELKPLTLDEQVVLFKSLIEIDNPEMTLAHLISLYTGARIQTVLTFRISALEEISNLTTSEARVKVGPGTGIDTKNDKLMTLFIPFKLLQKMKIYSSSNRARLRRARASNEYSDYLFLTNRGTPYYDAKSDIATFNERNTKKRPNNGQGIRQFIGKSLLPHIRNEDKFKRFKFKFHDLRATYGMNLTDTQLELVKQGKITLFQAREFVRIRMGHANANITDRYLKYRENTCLIRQSQMDYEEHIHVLTNEFLGGAFDIY